MRKKRKAVIEGLTVVDPATVIVTHLTEVIKSNAYEILGRQELQELLDRIKEKSPRLVDDLIPGILDMGTVHRVVLNLLKEGSLSGICQRFLKPLPLTGCR